VPNLIRIFARVICISSATIFPLAAFALLAGCAANSQSNSADRKKAWVLVSDPAGAFCFSLPIYPTERVETNLSSDGVPILRHEFIIDPDPSLELGVIYNDYPASLSNLRMLGSRSFFDTMQAEALHILGNVRLIYARDGTFRSHPMRELCFDVPEKRLKYQTRIIVVGHRMYQLIVVSSFGVEAAPKADKLFNSFWILHDE
jgi:hypothetical protein